MYYFYGIRQSVVLFMYVLFRVFISLLWLYAELITFGLCQIVKKGFCTIYCT